MSSARVTIHAIFAGILCVQAWCVNASAADVYPLFTDINPGGVAFGSVVGGPFGSAYSFDTSAAFNGNAVLAINQRPSMELCCHGGALEINISNGENGVNSTEGGVNVDVPNAVLPNPVFAAIGNPSGKLENGNVLRFSFWVRSDPANPITIEPQVAPIAKFEYWKEALSGYADFSGPQAAPQFGDRVFDQDQQGYALSLADLPSYVDINDDGVVALDPAASEANGRLTKANAGQWSRVSVTHTVNSANWLGIGPEAFGANEVGAIESIKAVLFMGDFAGNSFSGDGPDGGNLLVDNLLVEVFRNAAAVTPLANPNPEVPEPGSLGLALMLATTPLFRRPILANR